MRVPLFSGAMLAITMPYSMAAMTVTLSSSVPSPQPVGTVITWTASASGAEAGALRYRFRAHAIGQDMHMLKDYSPDTTLDWTAVDHDGLYEMEATVRNPATNEVAIAKSFFTMQSRVKDNQAVVTPTSHPLVVLYSAPPCPVGARMKIQFTGPDNIAQNTPYLDCVDGLSMNFYVGGLLGSTAYSAKYIVDTGDEFQSGQTVKFTTAAGRTALPVMTLQLGAPKPGSGILLQADTASVPMATDLNGNVVWYYPGLPDFNNVGPFLLLSPDKGGQFWGTVSSPKPNKDLQLLRKYDLTGMTVQQTNANRVSEQLMAMGKRPIGSFNHEARRLPDGKIAALASVEKIVTDQQGPGPVDLVGAMIVIMDEDLQVVWAWDSFDYLDVTRASTTGDFCPFGGCPPLFLAAKGNDWLHANALQQTPDGNLLLSLRHQDWVIKIDYQNGQGSGNILWRLGKDGDFELNSTDPNAWFSHQHDPKMLTDNETVILFDNANLQHLADPAQNSRGQAIRLDEQNHTATLILNTDLGGYSPQLGSAQKLPNGDFHFEQGTFSDGSSTAVEVTPSGQPVYKLHSASPNYRSFRMTDIYSPVN